MRPHARFVSIRRIDGSHVTFWASGTSPKIRELNANRDYAPPCATTRLRPENELASAALQRKTIVAEHVDRCVRKAVEASGGSAFFRKNPLEQLSRDIQGVHFHPLPEKKQLLFTGRVALGLSPV